MKLLLIAALFVCSCTTAAFAWDPSGSWTGMDGRSDIKLLFQCRGDACAMNGSSNYGRYKASCFVNGTKMVCSYNYQTETAFGFILFEQSGEFMLQKTFDIEGKPAWSGRFVRK